MAFVYIRHMKYFNKYNSFMQLLTYTYPRVITARTTEGFSTKTYPRQRCFKFHLLFEKSSLILNAQIFSKNLSLSPNSNPFKNLKNLMYSCLSERSILNCGEKKVDKNPMTLIKLKVPIRDRFFNTVHHLLANGYVSLTPTYTLIYKRYASILCDIY